MHEPGRKLESNHPSTPSQASQPLPPCAIQPHQPPPPSRGHEYQLQSPQSSIPLKIPFRSILILAHCHIFFVRVCIVRRWHGIATGIFSSLGAAVRPQILRAALHTAIQFPSPFRSATLIGRPSHRRGFSDLTLYHSVTGSIQTAIQFHYVTSLYNLPQLRISAYLKKKIQCSTLNHSKTHLRSSRWTF